MTIKKTSQVGDPVIRSGAQKVMDYKSAKLQKVIADLVDSMREHDLVGMAAPQIGESMQVFVTEIRKTRFRNKEQADSLRIFVNPRIISVSKKTVKGWEGCGSVAESGLLALVRRPESIQVEAFDEVGKKFQLKATGLLARVIQHENDHLKGLVFTDKADMKTIMSRSEFLKLQKKPR